MWYAVILLLSISLSEMGNPVKNHLWKKRILIVSASSPSNVGYRRQNQLLEKGKKGMKERDVLIFRLYADHWIDPEKNKLAVSQAEAIYQDYGIEKGTFSVTLIGKDGGVKMRQNDIVSTRELFQLIDRMPMRRTEMAKQKEEEH